MSTTIVFVVVWCLLQPWGCVVQTLNLRWALKLRREALDGHWEGVDSVLGRARDNITRFVAVWGYTFITVLGFFATPSPVVKHPPTINSIMTLSLFTLLVWVEYRFNMTATREIWRRRKRRSELFDVAEQ